ncbi:MAG: hypothetical protein U1E28_20730 [Beijerinckiaceae bacterium]
MRMIQSSALLRNVLIVDAAFSGASGIALASLAQPLATMSGLPYGLILGAGVFLMPYAIIVGSLGLCALLPPAVVWFVVAGNALWVVESLVTLSQTAPTAFGIVTVGAQAIVVAAIAAAQAIGLKRSEPLAA